MLQMEVFWSQFINFKVTDRVPASRERGRNHYKGTHAGSLDSVQLSSQPGCRSHGDAVRRRQENHSGSGRLPAILEKYTDDGI